MSSPDIKPSPLDRPLTITFFASFAASDKREQTISLRSLTPKIKNTTHSLKAKLPWLKLARFGDLRNPKEGVSADRQSLRHDKNLLAISGIEVDYDQEIVTVDEAVGVLRSAGLGGMVYTSPSHTDDTPRWRVLCPLSHDLPPEARVGMVERLNGLFHGALSGESFTLSQSYYYGSIRNNPSHRIELVDGAFLDERTDLDDGAIGKPKAEYKPTAAPTSARGENKSKFVEAVIRNALSKVRGAAEGQKHHTLRNQAILLGGYQHVGNYTNTEAVGWLMDALPGTVKDRKAAATTALWGVEQGAIKPISIPDLPPRTTPQEPPPFDPTDPGFDPGWEDNVVQFPSDPAPAARIDVPAPPRVEFLWFTDIEPVLDALDFVQGLLIEQSSAVIYGASNSGKTFWTTDLALHVSAGLPWNGRRVEQGGVLYCALEGGIGFRNRVSAWKAERGLASYDLPFAAITCPLNLRDPDAGDVSAMIDAIAASKERMEVPLKMIVIDTLSRAMAGGNENAPEDMGSMVMCMDRIRQVTGAMVLFIHHSGKDQAKGARGHSLLQAAIDTEIEVVADDAGGGHSATVVKQRELRKGDVFSFTLKVVELGNNRHGEAVTTCLVDTGAEVQQGARPPSRRLKGHPKRALEVLEYLIGASGRPGDAGVPSGCSSVPEKWWRDRFYECAMPGEEAQAKRKAFARATKDLIEMHVVGMAAARVWMVDRRSEPAKREGSDAPN